MILDTVEPGLDYEVPSIFDGGRWFPVFPTSHHDQDPEFYSNVREHYHVDTRFVDHDVRTVISEAGKTLALRTFRCLRSDPLTPVLCWMQTALYLHFAEHKLHNCKVCPHKGMPIFNGVCSGHGLKWGPDGRVKHIGPFRVRIPGTSNIGPVENLLRLTIECTENYEGDFKFEIIDRDGERVTDYLDPHTRINFAVGDLFYINNANKY